MKKWECTVCGYIHEGDEPPDECPVCAADKSMFVEVVEQGNGVGRHVAQGEGRLRAQAGAETQRNPVRRMTQQEREGGADWSKRCGGHGVDCRRAVAP